MKPDIRWALQEFVHGNRDISDLLALISGLNKEEKLKLRSELCEMLVRLYN